MINKWTATLSINAGLALNTEGLRIWVDAVHDEKVPSFSTLTPQVQRQLFASEAFQNPDVIFFTHCHPDHFSKQLCVEAMKRYHNAKLILPEAHFKDQTHLRGTEVIVPVNGRLLYFRRLIHEGKNYRDVPHYGMMIEDDGETILVLGDCALQASGLREWVAGRQIDAAIMPFPWITLRTAQEFIQRELRPRQLFIYHLPLEQDDVYHFGVSARKAAAEIQGLEHICLFSKAFQEEVL